MRLTAPIQTGERLPLGPQRECPIDAHPAILKMTKPIVKRIESEGLVPLSQGKLSGG